MTNKINWNDENTANLVALAGEGNITQDKLVEIANEMGTSSRSIGAKLRKLDFSVDKASGKAPSWTEEQEAELRSFVVANAGIFTYAEIAEKILAGVFNAKQVQGKLLNMELFGSVRKAEKKVPVRKYSEEEETKLVSLIQSGTMIEVIAEKFNKPISSIRGKALSLLRANQIDAMPKQATSNAKEKVDLLASLDLPTLTVDQVAEAIGKTARGVKSMLTRKGLNCIDYAGEERKEKLESKKEA
jgi:hypothetical protein